MTRAKPVSTAEQRRRVAQFFIRAGWRASEAAMAVSSYSSKTLRKLYRAVELKEAETTKKGATS